jgi:hypothetical protein
MIKRIIERMRRAIYRYNKIKYVRCGYDRGCYYIVYKTHLSNTRVDFLSRASRDAAFDDIMRYYESL